ncbi:hypothetical protein LCGC14_0707520 [marine sediment metagenome]|uniref:DNA-directed RNA polymerase n=1 Tax=marine sediment metagenome TaxID=412755 RepID=A0A0F9QKN0_9ZZZZ
MAENVYDRINDYGSVKILLASPNDVRSWSFGEVRKPETINYRTYRPEKDGLFCERIFGPERDWECACGKYKGTKHKGIICDRCQVKVTHSRVRRKRTGHISLAAPIVHIWYFKALPSRLGTLLAMKTADLEKIVLFQDYVVVDPGQTPLKYQQVLTEDEYRSALETYGKDFKALMGADAIKTLLGALDLSVVAEELREGLEKTASKQKIKDLSKRLKMVESLRTSGNQPEWMVMDVIPVIPPDLRPLVLLESGNFATSDLNDLYRRIINRNNRLKKLMDLTRPAMVAEYWRAGRHEGEQHLYIGIPSQSPGAPAPSHFDRIDDETAHCVSGSNLSPGDYPVGVAIPHPKAPGALFHLVNLPTPRRKIEYGRNVETDATARMAALSQRSVDRMLKEKQELGIAELAMLAQFDPKVVSRFASEYFHLVDDKLLPREGLPLTVGRPSRFGIICARLAANGTRDAAPGLLKAIDKGRFLPPSSRSPYQLHWLAALSIARRDPWREADDWLAQVQDIEAAIKLADSQDRLEEVTAIYTDELDAMEKNAPELYARVMDTMEQRGIELDRPPVDELHPAAMP